MVLTRSGAQATPTDSVRKSKRTLEVEDTPVRNKRLRSSPAQPQKKDGEVEEAKDKVKGRNPTDEARRKGRAIPEPDEDTIVVLDKPALPTKTPKRAVKGNGTPPTDPTTTIITSTEQKRLPVRARASPKVIITRKSPPEDLTPVRFESSNDVEEPSPSAVGSQKDAADDVDNTPVNAIPNEIPSSTFDSEAAQLSTQEPIDDENPAFASARPTKTHIRFDEEPAVDNVAIQGQSRKRFGVYPEHETLDKMTDTEDSDDDAPETISAATAISKKKEAEAVTARAHDAQKQKEKLKRKEADLRMKKEREQRRQKDAKRAERLDLQNLPDLLPEALLEAAGDKRPPTPPPEIAKRSEEDKKQEKLNRHIKFLERGEKGVKDVKKGRLSVHVLQQDNKLLAPKANRHTKNIREQWMRGRVQEKKGKSRRKLKFSRVERRAMGGGFVRGGED